MSRRLKRIVRSSVTIGILASQLIGCGTMSQEPCQKLEKENVIEAIQTVTEEEKEFLVETTSEEKESENSIVEEDTTVLLEVDKIEQIEEDTSVLLEVDKVEEDTENFKETTGIQIIEELNQKMYVKEDSYAYDIDGVNGERNLFNAGYGLDVTGLTINGWYRVESGGYIGYMWKENLSEDEYYSLGSRLAREEEESEAMRLELERESEAMRLELERESEVIEQSTESEEQRIAREEAERQAAEQARLEAEEKARQEEEQARLQAEAESRAAEQIKQNQEMNPDIPEEMAFEGGIKVNEDTFKDYGHTGEVADMTDMSVEDGLRYNTDMSTWDD